MDQFEQQFQAGQGAEAYNYAMNNNVNTVDNSRRLQDDWRTVDIVKERKAFNDPLYKLIDDNKHRMHREQSHAFYIKSLALGTNEFYEFAIFQDTIRQMANKFTNELLSNLAFKIKNREDTEADDQEIDSIASSVYGFTLDFAALKLADLCKSVDIYGRAWIKVNKDDAGYNFEIVEPWEVKRRDNGYIIYRANMRGELVQEIRTQTSDNTFNYKLVEKGARNPQEIEVKMPNCGMFEFTFETFTSVGHEVIKAYDLLDSGIFEEVRKNSSKVYTDKNLFKSSPVDKDIMQLIDVPSSQVLAGEGSKNANNALMTVANTPFSLGDIINAANKYANGLVIKRGLSKKTLGLDASAQDFASSLPYENDVTAKTINATRRELEQQLEEFIYLITGKYITVDMGIYELVSQEAITANNKEADAFRSLRMKVARELRLPLDHEDVLLETWRIKFDKGLEPDAKEEAAAYEAGLIPEADDVEDLPDVDNDPIIDDNTLDELDDEDDQDVEQ